MAGDACFDRVCRGMTGHGLAGMARRVADRLGEARHGKAGRVRQARRVVARLD